MIAPIYDNPTEKTESDRAFAIATHLGGMAKVGLASTDSALTVRLKDDAYGPLFEAMATMAGELQSILTRMEEEQRRGGAS